MKTKLIFRAGIAATAMLCASLSMGATNESRRPATYTPGNYDAPPTGPRRPTTQVFMRQKLVYSQGVLEGIALEKFDLVSKNALRLRNMTQSNLWFTTKQPDYMLHTTNYQRSIEALYSAAIDKNLDAATEAYANVARNCAECHRVVRLEQRKQGLLRSK